MKRITISYKKVTLTEISHACEDNEEIIEEEKFDLDKHDEEIRSDARRKFAEWLSEVTTFDCGYCQLHYGCYEENYKGCVERLIAEYEKEQKGEQK